jgi:hypothetical protein
MTTDRITDEQIQAWREDGYVIVPNLLTPEELTKAQANVRRYFPSAADFVAAPERYPHLGTSDATDQTEFPFAGDALNDITVHPSILSAAERALGTHDLSLVVSLVWAKYASTRSFDQDLHADYAFGYDLLYPRDDADYQLILAFIYYEDVTLELGPTYVVSKRASGDRFLFPNKRSREDDPELSRMRSRSPCQRAQHFFFPTAHSIVAQRSLRRRARGLRISSATAQPATPG